MTQEQLDLLIQYINNAIAEYSARNSSDGGLLESIRKDDLLQELKATLDNHEPTPR